MAGVFDGWSEFNVAMVGATAALAGLLIVAMSVNIGEIMKSPSLPPRAASSIASLVLALAAGALGLVPEQPPALYGVEVLAGAVMASFFQVHAIRVIVTDDRPATPMQRAGKSTLGVLPVAAFLVGGVLLVSGAASAGLAAVAIGSVFAVIAAIMMAWVVLVEVLR
jgi:hypothetical protein